MVVKVLTDNKNRSAAEVRHAFTKANANFADQGAVSRTFQRKGQIFIDKALTDEDTLMDLALEAGAEDVGLTTLKGHRSVGGMRASIYNAMPEAGIDALIDYMKGFEKRKA